MSASKKLSVPHSGSHPMTTRVPDRVLGRHLKMAAIFILPHTPAGQPVPRRHRYLDRRRRLRQRRLIASHLIEQVARQSDVVLRMRHVPRRQAPRGPHGVAHGLKVRHQPSETTSVGRGDVERVIGLVGGGVMVVMRVRVVNPPVSRGFMPGLGWQRKDENRSDQDKDCLHSWSPLFNKRLRSRNN